MKRALSALLLSFCSLAYAVSPALPPELRKANEASFDFSRMSLNAFVQLVVSDATDWQYVLDPDLLADDRLVSVRVKGKNSAELRSMLATVLRPLGYSVTDEKGIVRVSKTAELAKVETPADEKELVVYRPRFRSAQYLLDLTASLFTAQPTTKRAIPNPTGMSAEGPPGSAAAAIDHQSDVIAIQLTAKQAAAFARAMVQLDVATPEIFVQATLYEVTVTTADASALSLAAKLFSGKINVNLAGPALDNSVGISLPGLGIEAFVAALQTDARFHVVSNPRLRVKDGATARLVVGNDTPVLGNVTVAGNGTAVRSVEYKTSGVVLELSPQIRGDIVDMKVQQQVSSFSKTTTGVNDSPTLARRDLTTSITAKPGELIVLGGLVDTKTDAGSAGLPFLPAWSRSKSSSDTRTELMLVLSATAI